MIHSINV